MNPKKDEASAAVQQTTQTEILAHLADGSRPLSNAELGELSDLSADEVAQFETTWMQLGTERKRQILSRLEELTEDNVELNFDRIYAGEGTDFYAVANNRVSVTPLQIDLTHVNQIPPLREWLKQ